MALALAEPLSRPAFDLHPDPTTPAGAATRPFGLSWVRPGAPVLDLSGCEYDPHTQTATIDPALLPQLGTTYETREDGQRWPDKD